MEEVWSLIASPTNLRLITPPNMRFKLISTEQSTVLYPGQLLQYKVSPFLGIPLNWMTEILEVKELEYFFDKQKKGPYRSWRHEHYFKKIDGGVEMTDLVTYENPFGIIGKWANALMIKKKLRALFEYRFQKMEELFGKWEGQQAEIQIL